MPADHNLPHWNYYRLLEGDLEKCFRYVEPATEHHDVYSEQFARIILMACTEIENCLRAFALWEQIKPKPSSLPNYYKFVTELFPSFELMDMFMPRFSLGFTPWTGWSENASPDWWSNGYNKIKHDRLKHPGAATLIRAVKSVAALQVLLLHYYRRQHRGALIPADLSPSLIRPWDKTGEWHRGFSAWSYELPDDKQSMKKST
jgi:hypothetical protein